MNARSATDALVVGSGPVGVAMACELAQSGLRVRVLDAGPHLSRTRDAAANSFGASLRNFRVHQENPGQFSNWLGDCFTRCRSPRIGPSRWDVVSINVRILQRTSPALRHHMWLVVRGQLGPALRRVSTQNLSVQICSATAEWDTYFSKAESLYGVRQDAYDRSVRHTVIKDALAAHYSDLPADYHVQSLPMAVEPLTRRSATHEFCGLRYDSCQL